MSSQLDHIAVGGIAGAGAMGRYAVATDVASSPSYEINEPMVAVLFPVMARVQSDPELLKQLYLRTLGWSAVICTSASVGVALVAPEMVRLVLGPQWLDVIPLMPWLSLAAGIAGLRNPPFTLLTAIGLPHVSARMQWFRFIMLAAAVFPVAYLTHNLVLIAATQFASMAVFVPSLFVEVGRKVGVSSWDYATTLWRPFAAAGVMAAIVVVANKLLPIGGNEKLAVDVALGVVSFGTSILTLWAVSGRPAAPERDFLHFAWMPRIATARADT